MRGVLQKELPRVDRRLREFNVRDRLEGWYNKMNKPIRVGDSLWLLLRPGDVRLGGINVNDTAVVIDVRLFASPVIVSGNEPARTNTPLPPLLPSKSEIGDSARVLLESSIAYDAATRLRKQHTARRQLFKPLRERLRRPRWINRAQLGRRLAVHRDHHRAAFTYLPYQSREPGLCFVA